MRQFKRLIAFVLILVVLIVGLLLINNNKSNKDDNSSSFVDLCISEQNDIKMFTIEKNDTSYVFMPDAEGQWGLVKPKLDIKDAVVSSILAEVTEIKIKEKISDSAENLSQYGLDDGIKISIDYKNKKDRKFILGDALYDNQGFYFMESGKNEIYSISVTKGEVLSYDFSNMLNTTIADYSEEGLSRIVVHKNGGLVYDLHAIDNQYWKLVKPIEADIKSTVVEDTIEYNKVTVSAYVDSVSSKVELKKYGLHKPSYSIKVCGGSGTEVQFDLGKTDLNGLYFGRIKGSDYIFKIDIQTIPYINLTVKDLILQFVDFRMIEDLEELRISMGKIDDVFKIAHKKATNVNGEEYLNQFFTYKGIDITNLRNDEANQYFSDIYTGFVSVPWVELDYESQPKLNNPEVSVEYKTKDGKKHSIQYQRKNSVTYYVFKGGKFANLLVSKDDIDYAINSRKQFIKEFNRRYKRKS